MLAETAVTAKDLIVKRLGKPLLDNPSQQQTGSDVFVDDNDRIVFHPHSWSIERFQAAREPLPVMELSATNRKIFF